MNELPLSEAIVAFIAGLGAWLSWRAKAEATKAGKEARGANLAVNCNKDPDAPRLYELVADNGKKAAVIEERVNTIKDKQGKMETQVGNISERQLLHSEKLKAHDQKFVGLAKIMERE